MNSNLYLLKTIGVWSGTPQELPESETDVLLEEGRKLILHNDDYNTFDHVIKCLVEICDHSTIQAEQCAFIVHYNGKCDVMHGEDSKLDVCCRLLQLKGLSASIE
ncbi:MAG: ATP-dependent Clp protease adaptor ClpS [Salibacteraceae bacterium]